MENEQNIITNHLMECYSKKELAHYIYDLMTLIAGLNNEKEKPKTTPISTM